MIVLYDRELVERWQKVRRRRANAIAVFSACFFALLAAPLFIQGELKGLTYTREMVFAFAWIAGLLLVNVYLGIWRILKVKKSIWWECSNCGCVLQYRDIERMLSAKRSPCCGETFSVDRE